ncbi:allophanate hydrolase [Longimycelium tulufanense]|uniref:Allophanate hydrolase n=1 Tax=Longimycelium tulufanense TaxID=907463 RepID=A0A8J3CJT9_9PSEU|nr:5-oxoprolinase subunit PxpB [Longimycelium tulufanense]GGM73312.1 allophanate hydrolase [Longimycelium tulufanense]
MELRHCGPDAALVELSSLDEVAAVRAGLAEAAEHGELPGLLELVPAARTVLVTVRPGSNGLHALREVLSRLDPTRAPERTPREVVLPVSYDGPDLDLVAETAGLARDEVVALHTAASYSVAFCGFAPGFAYLVGLPEPLRQPRLANPRTTVPAGSVGVAGEFTAAYPRSSPGGWRLIGRTDATLFDPRRDPPALLSPGDRVRFEVA